MKVAIIGAGNVGASLAYALLIKGGIRELSLIDLDEEKALGHILDLRHGIAMAGNVELKAENMSGVSDADIIVITAGRGRRPNETRMDLTHANVAIYKNILQKIKKYNLNAIYVVVSNPVDILTYVTCKELGVPSSRVIGSGTVLDTSRFRYLISRELDVAPQNIHAYIIGEHGDTSVPVWSMANMGQIPIALTENQPAGLLSEDIQNKLYQQVMEAGKEVIRRKGATYYAVALTVVRILEAIVGNKRNIMTVSSYIDEFYSIQNVALSLPCVITKEGIREMLPIRLNFREEELLKRSAEAIKTVLHEIGY